MWTFTFLRKNVFFFCFLPKLKRWLCLPACVLPCGGGGVHTAPVFSQTVGELGQEHSAVLLERRDVRPVRRQPPAADQLLENLKGSNGGGAKVT